MGAMRMLCVVLAAAGLLAASPVDVKRPALLGEVFDEIGIAAAPRAWRESRVVRSLRRRGKRHVFWSVLAEQGPLTIRLEITTNLKSRSAGRLVDQRSFAVRALHRPAAMDYFGPLGGRAAIPDEFLPEILYPDKRLVRSGYPLFILWSSKEFVYAVEGEKGAVHKGFLGFRYCRDLKTLVQIEVFESAAAFEKERALKQFGAFQCP